jgi:phage terminase large subunit GpA-like protein
MLDDGCDPTIAEFVWIIASQIGKTLCLILIVEYYIDQDPSSILVVYPTIDSAKSWSREKFTPTVDATPRMKGKIKSVRSRDANNTTLNKKFPGGNITVSGANSPSGLRQRSKRIVILDEIDAMEPNQEGDPITQADARAKNFFNARKGKSSTPTIKGVSKIDAKYQISDKQQYFCPCPRCGHFQTLKWARIKFEFTAEELAGADRLLQPDAPRPHVGRDIENAVLVCENSACGAWLSDSERIEMICDPRSEWRATAPFTGIRGRQMSGLYQIIGKKEVFKTYLHEFVANFLESKKNGRLALMVWTNTFLAECWEEETERLEASDLEKRREAYGPKLPDQILFLTCQIDVQGQYLDLEVAGWGKGEEKWGVQNKLLPGNAQQNEVWNDLDAFLINSVWKTVSDRELRILVTVIDSGDGKNTDYVYRYCKPRFMRRVYAIKGSNQRGDPIVDRLKRGGKRKCPYYRVGTDTAKRIVYDRLKLEAAGPGFMHFPSAPEYRYDAGYFAELTSEEITVEYYKGVPRQVFKLPEGRRNEALDKAAYGLAAVHILAPDWEALEKNVARKIKEYQLRAEQQSPVDESQNVNPDKSAPEVGQIVSNLPAATKRPKFKRPGGFIKGWRS